MTAQTLIATAPESNVAAAAAPATTPQSEARGFALYVGIDEARLAADGLALADVVAALRATLTEVAPGAESYATVALAPKGAPGRNIDVARLALGEPAARQHIQRTKDDEAASGVILDLSRRRVLLDNIPAPLTYREFELLKFFVLREGKNITREEIVDTLWAGADAEEIPNARTVDVHVRRLRVKLEKYQDIIRTIRGVGYRFDRHADVQIIHGATRSPDRF